MNSKFFDLIGSRKEAKIEKRFPEISFTRDLTYKSLTSFGIGSAPLPLLAEADTVEQLKVLLKFCRDEGIPFFILGAGTNVVGMDTPYQGLVIRLNGRDFSAVEINGDYVTAGAYVKLPFLSNLCAKNGLSGLAPLSGIPGSVGGAVRMNAGANGREIGDLVESVTGVDPEGKVRTWNRGELTWSYRESSIPRDICIVKVILKLTAGDRETEEQAIASELENRKRREPVGRSAGCAFRNVSPLEPAGKLIDLCGLRGFRIGDLEVSTKHANYLLNQGNATERDYLRLIAVLRRAVSENFGFYLRSEIVTLNRETAEAIEYDTPAPLVNVLYGGVSSERDISLQSGRTVCDALRRAGFKVELTDLVECRVTRQMREAAVVYPVLHGGFGEDGRLQNLLEKAKIRFVGSMSKPSALVMDKIATKKLLREVSLPTARWAVVSRHHRMFPGELRFPVMIKAPCEGSTVGIMKVSSPAEWDEALEKEFRFADELLVEEFISGTEITVPILNARAMQPVEIVSPTGFYDWDAKYEYKNGETMYFCPPRNLSAETVKLAQEYALKFYHAARCRDILRVDFIIGGDGVPYILEGNSIPGNTAHSLVPRAAAAAGISMENLTASMVYAAMKRSREESYPVDPLTKPPRLIPWREWVMSLCALLIGLFYLITAGRDSEPDTATYALSAGGAVLCLLAVLWFVQGWRRR